MIGIALLAVALGGYGLMRFLPSLGISPTREPTATIKPTAEATASLTEVAILPAVTEETFAPTEAPSATSIPTETETSTPSAPLSEKTDGKGVEMVLVSAGDFSMGSSSGELDERPVHTVYLDAYYIDKFEVTNALYKVCVDDGKCKRPIHLYFAPESPNRIYYDNPDYDQYPVVYVDWNMAKTYCEWRGARLPTEAQWEKAARGDADARVYPWGKDLECKKANFQNCVTRTSEVRTYKDGKSPYGAYDMAGNVWEWVADWYSAKYYENLFSDNPLGPNFGQARVSRGGSWAKYDIRISNRVNYAPNYTNFDVGFRCASPASP